MFVRLGFLYGLCREQSLETCGRLGAILGAHVTEVIGAKMDAEAWARVRQKVDEACCD